MPPRVGSRHMFTHGVRDDGGRLLLTEREPYRFTPHTDNRSHVVVQGDTLFSLAGAYFAPLPRACGFWWVIADFQPSPIVDPTLRLRIGREVIIPARRVLTDVVLAGKSRGVDA